MLSCPARLSRILSSILSSICQELCLLSQRPRSWYGSGLSASDQCWPVSLGDLSARGPRVLMWQVSQGTRVLAVGQPGARVLAVAGQPWAQGPGSAAKGPWSWQWQVSQGAQGPGNGRPARGQGSCQWSVSKAYRTLELPRR